LRLAGGATPPPTAPARVQVFAEQDVGWRAVPLALVVGATSSLGRAGGTEAMENLRAAAARYGADAVLSVSARVDQGHLTFTGVAVKFLDEERRP
ncbi:MAG: hypothetical protein QME96_10900, partial [Myxococcota bacterium]|nr:hypothetical protein [Myxococcota bacterium]